MCALFDPGVKLRGGVLALEGGTVAPVPLLAPAGVKRLEPAAVAVRQHEEPFPAPVIRQTTLAETAPPAVLAGPSLAVAPATLPTRGLDGKPFLLTAAVHGMPAFPPPRVVADKAFMRGRPLLRRGVPARLLSDEQVAYWTRRLADARRLPPKHVTLTAIFPDLPLEGDRPVSYHAQEEAIAYHLPARPVPVSTIVVGRHALKGEPLQGRFYKDGS